MDRLSLTKSNELWEEALDLVPGGVLGIRRPYNFVQGEYPLFIERASGGRMWDVDGNEYIDLLCGYGPIILGHREPEIDGVVHLPYVDVSPGDILQVRIEDADDYDLWAQ